MFSSSSSTIRQLTAGGRGGAGGSLLHRHAPIGLAVICALGLTVCSIVKSTGSNNTKSTPYFFSWMDPEDLKRMALYDEIDPIFQHHQENGYVQAKCSTASHDNNSTSTVTQDNDRSRKEKAGLCCVAKNEEAYLDEFVDYHLALGFSEIHVYDNSNSFELRQWGYEKGCRVKVVHAPGIGEQSNSYLRCAQDMAQPRPDGSDPFTWAAFFDVDEFLLLKQHEHVVDMLQEYCKQGALSINWRMFGTGGRLVYQPIPVTKRFQYRLPDDVFYNQHIKCIAKLKDLDFNRAPHAHYPYLRDEKKNLTLLVDTSGKVLSDRNRHLNKNGPVDVAVLYHFQRKSRKEYILKRTRGRATTVDHVDTLFRQAFSDNTTGTIFDDAAWQAVKRFVPKYRVFDDFFAPGKQTTEDSQ